MKIVAFLQNQWFKNPDSAKRTFAAYEAKGRREELIKRFLFRGCKTGRMLKAAFGDGLCDEIIWEETSRDIGGHASSAFKPDLEHIRSVIEKHKPSLVLTFGKIALTAIVEMNLSRTMALAIISGPHPAARHLNCVEDLKLMASKVRSFKSGYETA